MPNPWDDDPIVSPPTQAGNPWDNDPIVNSEPTPSLPDSSASIVNPDSSPSQNQDPSFAQRVMNDYQKRTENAQDLEFRAGTGEKSVLTAIPESLIQRYAGPVADVGAEATVGAAKAIAPFLPAAPHFEKDASAALQKAGQYYDKFSQKFPETSDALNAVGTMAGALPVAQLGKGIASGALPAPKNLNALENVSADEKFLNAVTPVQNQYQKVLGTENKLWEKARDSGPDTTISGNVMQGLPDKIEAALNNNSGISLSDDNLKPIAAQIDKFRKFTGEKITADSSGELPVVKEAKEAPLNEIIALRKGVSNIAGKNPDGNIRHAAGVALGEIDDHLSNEAIKAIKGDQAAINNFQKALDYSKQKFKDFGTNSKTGQSRIFENIITKSDYDNSQIVKAFGMTSRGNQGTSQVINRLLDKAGPQREIVRSNIAQGYVERAIEKSMNTMEGGEKTINPYRFRVELSRLIAGSTSDGGMEDSLRKKVFTTDELNSLKQLRDNVKDARNWYGAVQALGVKIPMASHLITSPQVSAGRKAAKLVNDYLNQAANQSQQALKGTPFYYGTIFNGGILGAEAAKDAIPANSSENGK